MGILWHRIRFGVVVFFVGCICWGGGGGVVFLGGCWGWFVFFLFVFGGWLAWFVCVGGVCYLLFRLQRGRASSRNRLFQWNRGETLSSLLSATRRYGQSRSCAVGDKQKLLSRSLGGEPRDEHWGDKKGKKKKKKTQTKKRNSGHLSGASLESSAKNMKGKKNGVPV